MFTIPALKDVLSLADQQQIALPWGGWLLLILIIILLFVLLWRWLGLSKGGEHAAFPVDAIEDKVKPQATNPEPVTAAKPDDLTG